MLNYCSMTVNYCSILTLEIIGFFTAVIYHGKLPWYFYNIGPWSDDWQSIKAGLDYGDYHFRLVHFEAQKYIFNVK